LLIHSCIDNKVEECEQVKGQIGLDWIGVDWIGLDWIGLDWIGLDRNKKRREKKERKESLGKGKTEGEDGREGKGEERHGVKVKENGRAQKRRKQREGN
jgi:hypothetical protein